MLFGWIRKRKEIPVEQRRYDKIYLVLAGVLFLATLWAVIDEVSTRRPWKEYQRKFYQLKLAKLDSLYKVALANFDSSKYSELSEELKKAKAGLESDEYKNALAEYKRLEKELAELTREFQFAKSRSDEYYYFFQKAKLENETGAVKKWWEKIQREEEIMREFNLKIEELTKRKDSAWAIVKSYRSRVDSVQHEIDKLFAEINRIKDRIQKTKESQIKIVQVILPEFERTNFGTLKSRVDRCQTCHLGWNDSLFVDAPQPFRTHSNLELLQKHNPEVFGCTPCHRGQGPALTEGYAHGDKDKHWEWPILKKEYIEAGCNDCHFNEINLKWAQKLTDGKHILIESGCYGCHGIDGYNDFPKIAPSLNNLLVKTYPGWIYRWLLNPREYLPHGRMPNFYLTPQEAEAITAYLVRIGQDSARNWDYKFKYPGGGNPTRGKELVENIGCLGCHAIGENKIVRETRGLSYDVAPELTKIGSKVNPQWLYDWLKNPRHYLPNTKMPSLRLTDQEASDIVAYLMTLRDTVNYSAIKIEVTDEKAEQGLRLIKSYGCYGCHDIKGTEREAKVSVDISDFARKNIEQLDFGYKEYLPKDRLVWVSEKLRDPRGYSTERIQLKMPKFNFTDKEIEALVTLIASFKKNEVGSKYVQAFDKKRREINEGRRLTLWYNCTNCHQIEEQGGYIHPMIEDPGLRPPLLTIEGAKVQEPWLYEFLKNPTTIRPWFKLRMPTFQLTDDEITTLIKYFLGLSDQEFKVRSYEVPLDKKYVDAGRVLFDKLQCLKCHTVDSDLTASMLAPNLEIAHKRLKPEWVIDWLKDPQKIQPGTNMPTFFYEGISPIPDVLDGNADEQIRALRDYIWTLGRRTPSAVVMSR